MLILQIRCYFVDIFFFFFSLSHFSTFFFINVKIGVTPLHMAAEEGLEQIVQILLEKGATVDLADQVLLC